jgi:hypothetical protein
MKCPDHERRSVPPQPVQARARRIVQRSDRPGHRSALPVALLALISASPAIGAEFGMTCERAGKSYKVFYDTASRAFRTDNAQLGSRFRLNRVQLDKDAALVWVTALNFGPERDILVQFGREKWVKHFFGNGSEVTDRCR